VFFTSLLASWIFTPHKKTKKLSSIENGAVAVLLVILFAFTGRIRQSSSARGRRCSGML
jgi:hypothetical protein